MYEEVLSKKTKRLLNEIGKSKAHNQFYLAGGTALALQIGHRKSIDLDWFSEKEFSTKDLKNELRFLGKLKIDEEKKNTLNCTLDKVKLSFFEYPYKALLPFVKYNKKIKLAGLEDIACMKVDAISSRGSRKDFIDFYFLLKKFSLKEILELFAKKYKGIEYNKLHILKSLTYFKEAEADPMPLMLNDVGWGKIKEEIIKKAQKY